MVRRLLDSIRASCRAAAAADLRPAPCVMEAVESRRLMSVSTFNGMLFIDGTDQADQISVMDSYRQTTQQIGGFTFPVLERSLRVSVTTGASTTTSTFRASDIHFIRINAHGGNDTVSVNSISGVSMYGGAGSDQLNGGSGRDFIFGDRTDFGEIGVVQVGTPGNDVINGNAGDDHLQGDDGDDQIRGGAGNDDITGGAGNDDMYGEAGNDSIFARDGRGYETVDGGDGTDSAQIDSFVVPVSLNGLTAYMRVRDSVFNVEALI